MLKKDSLIGPIFRETDSRETRFLITQAIKNIEKKIPLPPSVYASQIAPFYQKVWECDMDHYGISFNPFSVQFINPEKITEVTGREWKPWTDPGPRRLIGRIKDGKWDKRAPPDVPEKYNPYPKKFEKTPRHRSYNKHFANGVPWRDTRLYDQYIQKVHTPEYPNFSTVDDIYEPLLYMENLFRKIKQNGYKSQLDLMKKGDSYYEAVMGEVLIDIGRKGQPLFVDGRHRLSIAKILGIDKIPVVVLVRHRQWVSYLERTASYDKISIF